MEAKKKMTKRSLMVAKIRKKDPNGDHYYTDLIALAVRMIDTAEASSCVANFNATWARLSRR
jgi:hypothetical protein